MKKIIIAMAIVSLVLAGISIFGRGYASIMNVISVLIDGFLIGYWLQKADA